MDGRAMPACVEWNLKCMCWMKAENSAEVNIQLLSKFKISGKANLLKTYCCFIIVAPELVQFIMNIFSHSL